MRMEKKGHHILRERQSAASTDVPIISPTSKRIQGSALYASIHEQTLTHNDEDDDGVND